MPPPTAGRQATSAPLPSSPSGQQRRPFKASSTPGATGAVLTHSVLELLREAARAVPGLEGMEAMGREVDRHYIGARCPNFYPAGATRYRLESALDPSFSLGRNVLEFPAGPYNLLVVGTPTWDGGVFYYRIAACNEQACSGWSVPLAVGRRIWPGPEHWNLVAGGFRFLDHIYLWAQNGSPVPGKASSLHLYEGLQGFGGQLRRSCAGVAPGGTCRPASPALLPWRLLPSRSRPTARSRHRCG